MKSQTAGSRSPRKLTASLSAALLGAVVSGQTLAADVTLRISLQLPLKSHLGQNLVLFEKEVEEKSSGSIDVEIYEISNNYESARRKGTAAD